MTNPAQDSPPPRFQQLRQLFLAAEEQPQAEREAFVRLAAGADSSLADEVLAMLLAKEGVQSTALAAGVQ